MPLRNTAPLIPSTHMLCCRCAPHAMSGACPAQEAIHWGRLGAARRGAAARWSRLPAAAAAAPAGAGAAAGGPLLRSVASPPRTSTSLICTPSCRSSFATTCRSPPDTSDTTVPGRPALHDAVVAWRGH